MKRLIITRHAKSSWSNLELSDHNRSLNKRGRGDCILIANWLASKDYRPDQVIASTATRCVETWEGIGLALECDAPVVYESALYHSSAEIMMGFLQKCTEKTVLLTAHNPGVGELAQRLCKTPPDHQRFYGYPSAATTVIDFDVQTWKEATFGSGNCINFIIPSDLK